MRKLGYFSLLIFLSLSFSNLLAQSEEYGLASYYGDEFQGGETASGEAYDKNKLTAAHKTIPLGSKVRVTHLGNKKSVVVRINDRGPYLKGRIIDLSGRAASAINMISDVTAEVKLEVLGKNASATRKVVSTPVVPKSEVPAKRPTSTTKKSTPASKKPKAATAEPAIITAKGKSKTTVTASETKTDKKEADSQFQLVTAKDYKEYDLYKIQLLRPDKKGYGVQVGSFSDYDNVMKRVAELQGQWFKNILMSVEQGSGGGKIYKIILGPFPDQATATSYKKHAKRKKKLDGFVVSLEGL